MNARSEIAIDDSDRRVLSYLANECGGEWTPSEAIPLRLFNTTVDDPDRPSMVARGLIEKDGPLYRITAAGRDALAS